MLATDDVTAIPIGCSCINQIQISDYFGDVGRRGSLLDWTIATPETTTAVLRAAADGTLMPRLSDRSSYIDDRGRLRCMNFPRLYFWHENPSITLSSNDETFETFVRKLRHTVANMMLRRSEVHLIWSNIQQNLYFAGYSVGVQWNEFILTKERYLDIRVSAGLVFNDPITSFVGRRGDIDPDLIGNDDVFVLDIERHKTDFKGSPGLFRPVFDLKRSTPR